MATFLQLLVFSIVLGLCSLIRTSSARDYAPYAVKNVYLLNLTYTAKLSAQNAFEHMQLAAAISGLANRQSPTFYTILTSADEEWLEYLRQPDQWLHTATLHTFTDIAEAVDFYTSVFQGVVLYDPGVPATSNLASTAAGAESLLPVCYRPADPSSLYNRLVASGPKLKVLRNFVNVFNGSISGSSKCDVYIYGIKEYIASHMSDASYLGFYIDYFWTKVATSDYTLSTAPNHDFFVSKKAFFFDLDVWDDEAPNDDPSQPVGTDRNTMINMLQSAYQQTNGQSMIHIGGFTPWAFKYVGTHSQHNHGGVDTEWESVRVFTSFNAFVDADACCIGVMGNAAFYQHFPLPQQLIQNPKPTVAELKAKGYIDNNGQVVPKNYAMFYVGDYDSAAWLYSQFKGKWDDPNRGKVPLGWAIDPELAERFPVIFPYIYDTKSPLDYFVSGDSGGGYLNPTQLIPPRQVSNISLSAAPVWRNWNIPLYQKFNMTFTGFIIQGRSGQMTEAAEDMYTHFSPDGIVLSPDVDPVSGNLHAYKDMPIFKHISDIGGDVDGAVKTILSFASEYTKFYVFRSVLQNATYHYTVANEVKLQAKQFEFVDPYTLSLLAKVYLKLPTH